MRLPTRSSLITLMALTMGAQLGAQASNATTPRQGNFFSGGIGYGSYGCEGCEDRVNGITGGLSFGRAVSPRLVVGVGSAAWTKSEDGARFTIATLDARVRFYPSLTNNFFVTGGAGLGMARGSFGSESNTEFGPGLVLGLGYDIPMSGKASITPFLNGVSMRADGVTLNFGQLGVALTLR